MNSSRGKGEETRPDKVEVEVKWKASFNKEPGKQ